jgi:hypothetical protein
MKLGVRIFLAAAMAFALSACGGNGAKLSTKDQAAAAMFGAANGDNSSAGALRAAVSYATASGSGTASCRNGHGSVSASIDVSSSSSSGNIAIKLSYDGCEVGDFKNSKGTLEAVSVDGDVTYVLNTSSSGTTYDIDWTLNGKLDFSGGIDDSLEIDNIHLTAAADTGAATYSVGLTGTLKTNEATFTYDASYSLTGVTSGQFTATEATP